MGSPFHDWLDELRGKRQRWVSASHENNFDRGIWNATVDKYADPSHFIFELLQNAEDAGATWVKFNLGPDRIIFEHNGRAFDRDDIEGITGIGNTTKLDDGHKIGCFGIGFKSVYVITERPEVHAFIEGEPLAFAIENLVVPQLIETHHDEATTRIVLPLRNDRAPLALMRAREGLAASGARSLLFLRNIKRLDWLDGDELGSVLVTDHDAIRSIVSTMPGCSTQTDRYYIVARAVKHHDSHKHFEVKSAFRLNSDGDLIAEESPTKLMVFFETEEPTGLHFTIHGPFQLTDNRGNIKRDDPWNAELVNAIAAMVADLLPALRDQGLLKRGVLDLLPNGADELPAAFAPILPAIVAKFSDEDLLPVHNGGYTTKASGIRGPADLRDLLADGGLVDFCNKPNRRWIVSALKSSRADAFINTLKVEDFGHAEFFVAFRQVFSGQMQFYEFERRWRERGLVWFNSLSDDQIQHFYIALDAAQRAIRPAVSIGDMQFVRLEDGRRHNPRQAVFGPVDSELESETDQGELFLVKRSLTRIGRGRGKDVEQFLRRVGVRDLDERAYLSAIIRTKYLGAASKPNRERHLQHMRRFIRWWKDGHDVRLFAGLTFIRAGADAGYHSADQVYLGPPYLESGLSQIYDGSIASRTRVALWDGYKALPRKDLLAFLQECGVEDRLTVVSSSIPYSHPHWREFHSGWGSARHTTTGTDVDYHIGQLSELLAKGDPAISKLVWDAARNAGASAMTAKYAPNQTYETTKRSSSLAIALSEAEWIPTKEGVLRRPREITPAELAKGYPVGSNEDWLRAIGLGEQDRQKSEQTKVRRQAGQLIGLPPELVDKLGSLSQEALASLSEDIIRKIASRSFEPVEFPEREAGNPARRAERLAARAVASPQKAYEIRDRSVRVSNLESRTQARTYLEDQYTNPLGEMVCQSCHGKMPFNLPDGTPYFEAVECFDALDQEQTENHLALCPTCAAKWRHANPVTDTDLREKFATAGSPELMVDLAGTPTRLRFTQVHFDDIRAVAAIDQC